MRVFILCLALIIILPGYAASEPFLGDFTDDAADEPHFGDLLNSAGVSVEPLSIRPDYLGYLPISAILASNGTTAPPPKPPAKWSGTAEGNLRSQIATVDASNTTLKSDIYRDADNTRFYTGLLYLRGKSDEKLNIFQRRAELKIDRKLKSDFYGYLQQVFEDNQMSQLELLSRSSGGFGYHFLNRDNIKLAIYLGASYTSEEYENLDLPKRSYSYQLADNLHWKIVNGLVLDHKFEYLPRSEDLEEYKTRSDASLKIYFGKYLYGGFSLINEYDSNPGNASISRHTATSLVTIGFRF
jgi:hypothetical protein